MSTPVITPIVTQLHPISVYLKAHEKLVLLVIAGLVLWFGIGKVDTLIQRHDSASLQQATTVANANAAKTQTLAETAQKQAEEYAVLSAHDHAENIALEQVNAQLSVALAQRQKTDASLPTPELANRWTVLVPQAKPTVTATGLAVDNVGAIATVQQLEQVPVLQTELSNTKVQLTNVDTLLTASTGQIVTLNSEVSSLRLQQVDDAKVCTAQIAVVKVEARRSKRRWFIIGYVAGFISRQAIKTYTGF